MNKQDINEFYEEFHKLEVGPISKLRRNSRYKFIRKLLKNARGKVLVVGCGSEKEMSVINDNCGGVGIDISNTAIEKSKKKYPRFEYHVMDATNLRFDDNFFDAVVCSEVIEHLEDSDKLLREVNRILKSGGKFVITTPNWWSFYGLGRKIAEGIFKKPFTSDNQPLDNWSTPSSLRRKLLKYFKIRKFYGLWYYPPNGKDKIRIPEKFLMSFYIITFPLELLLRRILPWFGHILIFEVENA